MGERLSVISKVRRAHVADLQRILEIGGCVAEAPRWTEAMYRKYLENKHSSGLSRALLVSACEGPARGFVALTVLGDECELENLTVDPVWRRHGIGRGLLMAGLGWARNAGARRFRLEVRSRNEGAVLLYEGCGLRRAGVRRGYYERPADDAVLMEMKDYVGPGAVGIEVHSGEL